MSGTPNKGYDVRSVSAGYTRQVARVGLQKTQQLSHFDSRCQSCRPKAEIDIGTCHGRRELSLRPRPLFLYWEKSEWIRPRFIFRYPDKKEKIRIWEAVSEYLHALDDTP